MDPKTGDEVPPGQVRKGYEVEPGTFVLLDQEELRRLEPEPSRDIEMIGFFKQGVIGREWYEWRYYLERTGTPTATSRSPRRWSGANARGWRAG